ncbi:hypothetical protein CesoFtcFv8_017083 [Champsocephalus esox]|uniref:Uncharacterized protein n=1 Tax=Champsocephalus esox TaxID=159716 RepID=A0AAN8BJK8_9TELE|nr:hypothetical protein CesoFtcFv8_017083 [Champsocephalus esox]
MTTRATKRNHSQSGGPKPRQKPKSGQTVQTDGAQGLAFCSVVELQLGQSLWQLDLHPDPTVAWEDREGAVPCADSCDSIGNGIDYCSWTRRFLRLCISTGTTVTERC